MAGTRADILGLGFPPLLFPTILFRLQHPVLGLQAFDSTEMFGVVSHYGKAVFAGCDADEQVEILNGLANGLQPNLLAAE